MPIYLTPMQDLDKIITRYIYSKSPVTTILQFEVVIKDEYKDDSKYIREIILEIAEKLLKKFVICTKTSELYVHFTKLSPVLYFSRCSQKIDKIALYVNTFIRELKEICKECKKVDFVYILSKPHQ